MIEHDTPDIIRLPLHEITAESGEAGLIARLDLEIESTDWDADTKQSAYDALDTALSAHAGVFRGKHPYSTHFLRVAIRIISPDHLAVRDRPELVIAALLHDTVEDNPGWFVGTDDTLNEAGSEISYTVDAQALAIGRIAEDHGLEVAQLVAAVTNPEFPSDTPKREKNRLYQEHVADALADDQPAAIIKLSDFIDNCVGLVHNESTERAKRLAKKYYPLIDPMRRFVSESIQLSAPVKSQVLLQLNRAEDRCLALHDTER